MMPPAWLALDVYMTANIAILVICPIVVAWRVLRQARKRYVVIKIERER